MNKIKKCPFCGQDSFITVKAFDCKQYEEWPFSFHMKIKATIECRECHISKENIKTIVFTKNKLIDLMGSSFDNLVNDWNQRSEE